MAQRRMFSNKIVDTDAFLDMPLSSQALYFHLSMRADDDGFIGGHKKIMRMIGCSEDDMKILLAKNFIIPFESGVCVIKHWKIHNYIQSDRYSETTYVEEKARLEVKKNKSYTLKGSQAPQIPLDKDEDDEMDTNCIQDGYTGKDRLGKVSLGKSNIVGQPDAIPYKEIIEYLNAKTEKNFKSSSKKNKDHIKARFNDGFNLSDFKKVIDIKTREWKDDPKMEQFLRPETLFSNKFEGYLNQKEVHNNKPQDIKEWQRHQKGGHGHYI